MGIAESYEQYIDTDATFPPEDVDHFVEAGLDEFCEQRVASLLRRWQVMNLYVAADLSRPGTAKEARALARRTCSWLMTVSGMESFDWTTVKYAGPLMPERDSEEWRVLMHIAASLDISLWLAEWREDTLARMQWFCTISQAALDLRLPSRKAFRKRVNKTINAIQKELSGVVQLIQEDRSKQRKGRPAPDAAQE